ncbi:LCP family protein [Streptomyces sp. MRC013]|uniref:LCP family protein n=1 Tax=Streptomyces sp. MRC013 TaxID=2898276 RepID=UPI0020264C4A|nr:LCP family protein [Streptomyces sp. MRC013]URM91166.1 LCP family protein [Streptomyces sp. MRC013]
MDAHSRGGAEGIDPADQWVLNPQTGNYELRLDDSAERSPSSAPSRATAPPPRKRRAAHGPSSSAAAPAATAEEAPTGSRRRAAEVPGQRRRRAAEPPAQGGGRRAAAPAAGRRRGKGKGRKTRTKKALVWTGGVTAFVLLTTGAGAYYLYERFNGNLSTIDVAGAGGGSGFKRDQAINILVIGTDKRTGDGNSGYGDRDSPGHADTTILLHVSKDRTNATALSIPRDLITDIPECTTRFQDGSEKKIPAQSGVRFNTSLGQMDRDPGCTMATVHEMTGVPIDHFMMVDFNAVKTLSSAVGGVEVCVEQAVKDKKSGLDLPAGTSVIEGEQALAFVRTRQAFGNKSDLSRIRTQQQFMGSMFRKMKSSDTLTSPSKLLALADAATDALTVDRGIGDVNKLKDLGMEIAKVDPKNITFATIPVLDNPAEQVKATVVLDEAKAEPLFSIIKNDISLTEVEKKEKDAQNARKEAQAALLKGPRAKPADVRVDVYNGSGVGGGAQATINWLQNSAGVLKSTNRANAPAEIARTTLEYAPNQADQARALADLMGLPASALKQGTADAGEREPMTLTLGRDFRGAGVPLTGPAKAPEGAVAADKQVCAK